MKKAFVANLFKKLAKQAGVEVELEERYGFVGRLKLKDGSVRYFRDTKLDINTMGASEVAKDKDYSYYFLKRLGYPVIEGEAFFSNDWARTIKSERTPKVALSYARKLGFPLMVKPNSLSQGQLVCKVANEKQFLRVVKAITKKDKVFLVQKLIFGRDYRIVVLDDEIISAYERLPLSVVGDGSSNINDLIEKKQRQFDRIRRDTKINKKDFRITNKLRSMGLNRNSVPKKGMLVELLDNKNLSSGGEAIDVTDKMHEDYKRLCIQIVKDMGLRYCGIDFITEDDVRYKPQNYKIIEINSAPGIDNYASSGREQMKKVEKLYLKVLKAMATSNKVYLLGESSTEQKPVKEFLSFNIVKYR